MSLPKFEWTFNFGHVLSAVVVTGSLLGIWRASEIRAVELAKDQQSLDSRLKVVELNQERFLTQLQLVTINQEKTAAILDQHIKLTVK